MLHILSVTFRFAWYDLWVGAYWDGRYRVLWLCPLPCCAFRIAFRARYQKRGIIGGMEHGTHLIDRVARYAARAIVGLADVVIILALAVVAFFCLGSVGSYFGWLAVLFFIPGALAVALLVVLAASLVPPTKR